MGRLITVAGWDGGAAWINSTALLARSNFVLGLLSPDDATLGRRFDPTALARRHGFDPGQAPRFLADLLVQDALDPAIAGRLASTARTPRDAAALLLTAPEYQLA